MSCMILSQTDLWWLSHSSWAIYPAWKCAMCRDRSTRVKCLGLQNLCTWCTYVPSTHFSSFFCEAFLLASLALPATQEVHSKFLSALFVLNCCGSCVLPWQTASTTPPTEVSLLFVVFSVLLKKGRCTCVCVCVCARACVRACVRTHCA
jgi:hypothetical protein